MRTAAVLTLTLALATGGCHRANTAFGDDLGVGDAPDLASDEAPDMAGGNATDLADSNPPDMTPPTPLAKDFRIYAGTTTGGWAVLADAAGSAWAVKISDGTERHIADHQQRMWTTEDASFVIHDGQNGVGKLDLWHDDGPPVHLAEEAIDSVPIAPPLSDGAGHITYITWVGPGFGALWLDTVDHAAPRVVYGAVSDLFLPSTCTPKSRFFAGRLLVQHCAYPSTNQIVLSSYDLDGQADVDLATDVASYDVAKGVGVLITSKSGTLDLVAADGSGKLTQTPLVTDARSARFTADGSAAIVVTKTSAIERVDMTTHAVTVLQSSGVRRLYHLSDDGNWATYMHTYDSMTDLYDIWLTDARHAGTTPVALDATLTTVLFGTFSADSAFALYLVDVNPDNWTGSLRARPVAGGAERIIATADDAVPVGGSRIVYTDNVTGSYPDIRADIFVLDLAGGAPTRMATQAYHSFDVLADGVTLVYLQPGKGLRVAKLP